jgi:predicted DNA-binding antitoxin AbrB/MazE fold protein
MNQIEAVYQGGVFRPLHEIKLPENQRVRLHIEPLEYSDVRAWLEGVQQFQQKIIAERGYFPDSTPDIAADRLRDE